MLKNILNLEDAQELLDHEKKIINGGISKGCKCQFWEGSSLENCMATKSEGHDYYFSAGICKAYFCGSYVPPSPY